MTHDMKPAVRCAVFDLDGTLHPGVAGIRLLQFVVDRSQRDPRPFRDLVDYLARVRGDGSRAGDTARRAYELYAEAVRGQSVSVYQQAASELWRRESPSVFPLMRELVSGVKKRGFRTVLISGSPDEIAREAAVDLGMEHVQGAVFTSRDGRYDGGVGVTPGAESVKLSVLLDLLVEEQVDLGGSCAIGNSSSDIDLLKSVGSPVVFEPDAGLEELSADRGWPVVDRRTSANSVLALLAAERGRPHVRD